MNFSCMSPEEVKNSYKNSKNKEMQVGILCDICLCSRKEMMDFLGIKNQIKAIADRDVLEAEWLKLYHEGLSDNQIAQRTMCTKGVVHHWRQKNNLPTKQTKGRPNKPMTDDEKRMDCYKRGLTDAEAAAELHIEKTTYSKWRRNNGLEPITSQYYGNVMKGTNEERMELYRAGYSDEQIAEKLGCTRKAINSWRKLRNLPPNYEPKKSCDLVAEIKEKVDFLDLLDQLAEEACELGHAALKMKRVLKGTNPTPVTAEDAREKLLTECADVLNGMLMILYDGDKKEVSSIMKQKQKRWVERLNGKAE